MSSRLGVEQVIRDRPPSSTVADDLLDTGDTGLGASRPSTGRPWGLVAMGRLPWNLSVHPRTLIPSALSTHAHRQAGLVTVADAVSHGLTRKQISGLVRRGEMRRAAVGVVGIVAVEPDAGDWAGRRLQAAWLALLSLGPHAISVGSCAVAMHGIAGLPSRIRPEAALPGAGRRRSRSGIAVRQFDDGMTSVIVAGRPVVTIEWAIAQAVPELPRRHGLAVLDAALRSGRLSREGLERSHELARGRRGVASRHHLWALADTRAESPLESFARLECVEAGVAPDVLQLCVRNDDGHVVARADMAWRRWDGRWLLVEMDGRDVHATVEAVYADRHRQNRLVAMGNVDVLRFTGRDLGRIAGAVRRGLSR